MAKSFGTELPAEFPELKVECKQHGSPMDTTGESKSTEDDAGKHENL